MTDYFSKYRKYKLKYLASKELSGGKKEYHPGFKYIIFSGDMYYPSGGWYDFVGTVDTLDEAKKVYEKKKKLAYWVHVVDMESGKIVLTNWPEQSEVFGKYLQRDK